MRLSETEKQSLIQSTKAHLKENEYTPLVDMYVIHKTAQKACTDQKANCIRKDINNQLRQMVLENPYYQSECYL